MCIQELRSTCYARAYARADTRASASTHINHSSITRHYSTMWGPEVAAGLASCPRPARKAVVEVRANLLIYRIVSCEELLACDPICEP